MGKFEKVLRGAQAAFAAGNVLGFLKSPAFAFYVLAPALTTWALIAGVAEKLETPYLLAACTAVFGLVNWGLYQASLWIDRSKVQSKLFYAGMTNSQSISAQSTDSITLDRIDYGVHLQNNGHFPIHFRIKKFRSSFAGRAQVGADPQTKGVVMPNRPSQLGGSSIILDPPIIFARGDTRDGTLELDIEYWRWSWPKKHIRHNFKTTFSFHQHPAQFSWSYDDEGFPEVSD